MKKLFLLILFLIIASGVFSEPKIPFDNTEDPYVYVSDDFSSSYEISIQKFPNTNFQYALRFRKISVITNSQITLDVYFNTEIQLNNFIKDIHLSNLENEFIQIRKKLIDNDAYMKILNKEPYKILYEIDGSAIK